MKKYNMKDLNTVAIDFETYYSKTHSISSLGMQGYARHPDTDIYLVSASIAGDGGHVSDPQSMPWEEFTGQEWTWVSHNAAFDEACYRACVDANGDRLTDVYGMPGAWECTADMVAYLGCKRDLKTACKELLGKDVSKDTRKMMEGRHWDDLDENEMMQLVDYASADSDLCLELWLSYCHEWPDSERRISRLTREMCARGFELDLDRAEDYSRKLASEIYNNAQDIPWHGAKDPKGKAIPTTSPKAVKEYCHIKGIDPPKSMAKTSPEFEGWLRKYGEKFPFAKALGNHRSLNRTCELVKRMASFTTDEGRMSYGLKYFGAKTGRWSGDAGVNVQNFPRKAVAGVDVRSLIIPKDGCVLLQADYGQIEARVALMLAQDSEQLAMVASGVDLYEAHARLTMGYDDSRPMAEVDPQGRQLAKARVLGLGFGCGAAKFVDVARILGGLEISLEDAQNIVSDYRRSNQGITKAWKELEASFASSARMPGVKEHRMPLPSGREIVYHSPHYSGRDLACTPILGQGVRKVYGGLLFENCLSGDTLVKTRDGIISLRDVSPTDEVWDGEDFVKHDGLVNRGEQEVIEVGGIVATPDHEFMVDNRWVELHSLGYAPQSERPNGKEDHPILPFEALPAGCVVRRSGRKEQVYDILNCGPRQRFAVYNSKGEEAIAHNCVQATARDIFAEHLLTLRDLGDYFVPVLIVHDEVLLEVPFDSAEEATTILQSVMESPPSWCKDLPLTADVTTLTQYTK